MHFCGTLPVLGLLCLQQILFFTSFISKGKAYETSFHDIIFKVMY